MRIPAAAVFSYSHGKIPVICRFFNDFCDQKDGSLSLPSFCPHRRGLCGKRREQRVHTDAKLRRGASPHDKIQNAVPGLRFFHHAVTDRAVDREITPASRPDRPLDAQDVPRGPALQEAGQEPLQLRSCKSDVGLAGRAVEQRRMMWAGVSIICSVPSSANARRNSPHTARSGRSGRSHLL